MKGTAFVTNKRPVFKENLNPTSSTHARTATGFNSQVGLIRIVADAPIYYKVGNSSVVATKTDSVKMLGGGEYIQVSGGEFISVIAETTVQEVNISEMH